MILLYDGLRPTPEVSRERQSLLIDLLHSATPTVVGFALKALKSIASSGQFNGDAFVAGVRPALELRQKVHPQAALQILRTIARRTPERSAAVALAATPALAHTAPDVQKAAADLIEALATGPDDELAAAVASQIDLAAPTVRTRLEVLLAKWRPVASDPTADVAMESKDVGANSDPDHSAEAIADIPARWRDAAGLDACRAALANGCPLPRLQFDPMAVPRLYADARLTPIGTLDELIDRTSAAIEQLDSAEELELILDGMSRLGVVPADEASSFAARTAPLAKRIADLKKTRFLIGVEVHFHALIAAWLEGTGLSAVEGIGADQTVAIFLRQRLVVLRDRLSHGICGPLLACPTHRGGWLCPMEFVRRIEVWRATHPAIDHEAASKGPTGRYDLIQALLRLAPDRRDEALHAAIDLPGEWGAAVRHALGGDEPIGPTASLWIAACRARQPFGVISEFAAVHGEQGPDAASPANYDWHVSEAANEYASSSVRIKVTPSEPFADGHRKYAVLDRPVILLNRIPRHAVSMDSIANIRHAMTVWPANVDAVAAQGAKATIDRLDMAASVFSPTANYLELLFDPDRPLSEMGRLLLTAGLMSRDAGTRGLAVDVTIAAIEDGRLRGTDLQDIFSKLGTAKGLVKFKRLNEALGEIARISPLHREAAADVVQGLIAALPTSVMDMTALLMSLLEWQTANGTAVVMPAVRDALANVGGGGKTSKLARELLKLEPKSGPSAMAAAALAGRIARARRWAFASAHHRPAASDKLPTS